MRINRDEYSDLVKAIRLTRDSHNTFHQPEDVEAGLDLSLKNLGLQYGMRLTIYNVKVDLLMLPPVDLYLMHSQYFSYSVIR